ncbi:MAG: hypothetical protein HOI23_11715 [Deltaproteobacteria bacterium]|nr:hypothetical protein [Deltaproteobacteria bacterium]
MAKLPKGTDLILKGNHGERTMVKTTSGKLGFVKASWLKQTCAFSTPEPVVVAKPKVVPVNAPDAAETAAALQITAAAAETGNAAAKEVAAEMASTVEQARTVRQASASQDCEDRSSGRFRVAVYNLELQNIPEGMGKVVSESLLAEVRKLEGISAIGMEEIYEMLQHEQSRQVMGCEADDACLAEIAGALGVDELVTGRLSEEADGRVFVIRRINQRRAEVVSTVNKRLKVGNGEEFLLAIGPGVEELYAGRENRPGTKRGVPKKVLLRLNPPPIDAVVTWSTIAAGAAALALGGTFAYLGSEQARDYENGAGLEAGRVSPDSFRDLQSSGERNLMIGNVGLILGGTVALTSAIMSFFTDWDDVASGDDEE